jgi:CheY-like chemotaxis protein
VAEADPTLARRLVGYLEGWNIKSVVASDGAQALMRIFRFPPDLVILGADLPSLSGRDLTEVLRRAGKFSRTKLIRSATEEEPAGAGELEADATVEPAGLPETLGAALAEVGLEQPGASAGGKAGQEVPDPRGGRQPPGGGISNSSASPRSSEGRLPAGEEPGGTQRRPPAAPQPPLRASRGLKGPSEAFPSMPAKASRPASRATLPEPPEGSLADSKRGPSLAEAMEGMARDLTRPPSAAEERVAFRAARPSTTADGPPARSARPGAAPRRPRGAEEAGRDPRLAEAERLARIIVSDIVLYNEERFDQAARTGNMLEAMSAEIEEGRALFEARISEDVRAHRNFLVEELERVAARRRAGSTKRPAASP